MLHKSEVKLIQILNLALIFYPKKYISSPGHVDPEYMAQFDATAPKCIGWSYLTNADEVAADWPGESLCFGVLTKNKK
jgi:hypothetical protein